MKRLGFFPPPVLSLPHPVTSHQGVNKAEETDSTPSNGSLPRNIGRKFVHGKWFDFHISGVDLFCAFGHKITGDWPLSILVILLVIVTKSQTRNTLREEGFIWDPWGDTKRGGWAAARCGRRRAQLRALTSQRTGQHREALPAQGCSPV